MFPVETIVTGLWRENCYVVKGDCGQAIVIDPGEDCDPILGFLEAESLTAAAIINTHAHYDHVGSVADLKARYCAPFHLHVADHDLLRQANFYRKLFGGRRAITIPDVDVNLADCPRLHLSGIDIMVIHTPGHTPGSVSFLIDGFLFCGDTIFAKRLGRTDLPGGDRIALCASVQKLLALPPSTMIFPGHGAPVVLADILTTNAEVAEILA